MAKQAGKKKKSRGGGIVPRTVFAVAVSIGSVPAVEACGGSHAEYGVAAPSVAAFSGGESTSGTDGGVTEVRFGADGGVDGGAVQLSVAMYGVAAEGVAMPPPGVAAMQRGVAALPRGVAARPDYYGVAAPRHKS